MKAKLEALRQEHGLNEDDNLYDILAENALIIEGPKRTEPSSHELLHMSSADIKKLARTGVQEDLTQEESKNSRRFKAIQDFLQNPEIKKDYDQEPEIKFRAIIDDPSKDEKEKQKSLKECIKTVGIAKLKAMRINDQSLLKYAMDQGHVDLAIDMVKMGLTVNITKIRDDVKLDALNINHTQEKNIGDIGKNKIEQLELSNRPFFNVLKKLKHAMSGERKLSDKDQLRAAIAGNDSTIDDLSNKPSLVQVAMKAGKSDLALALIKKGHRLKRSEINEYMKQEKQFIDSSVRPPIKGKRFSLKQFDVDLQEKLAESYSRPSQTGGGHKRY